MIEPDGLLLLSHLRVQNANAVSSPLVWGFPSPTMFLGFAHALHRAVEPELGLSLDGVAIVCHAMEAQASNPSGKRTTVFHLTRNPLTKEAKSASIVEEGRVHLDISLVIGVSGEPLYSGEPLTDLAQRVAETASSMRIAGGSLIPDPTSKLLVRAELHAWPGTEEAETKLLRQFRRRLLPGFALVSREGLLEARFQELKAQEPTASMLDAWLDLSSLNVDPPSVSDTGESTGWHVRQRPGWLVPIAAGYQALTGVHPPGTVKNTRDRLTPFRFVEGVYTMGEWVSPHRVRDLRHLLWTYAADPHAGTYRVTTPHFPQMNSQSQGK